MEILKLNPDLTGLLLAWYSQNARDLPWRHTRDPYAIWLSEIMLQQTQVDTVIPYYHRFLAALPTLEALARAPEEQVLKLWEGLGYYSRARNLHRCAQAVVQRHGALPDDYKALRALPGIGEYTAGAVMSIAFGRPCPAVDGNVLRVVARLLAIPRDVTAPAVKRAIAGALEAIYPQQGCGDFTQSLMELGATVCTPVERPRCGLCPVAGLCAAKSADSMGQYPVLPEKRPRRAQDITVFALWHQGCLAVRKRPESGLLAGLWELPNVPGALDIRQAGEALAEWGVLTDSVNGPALQSHIFTHVQWTMHCYGVHCTNRTSGFDWISQARLSDDYALPVAFQKCLGLWADMEGSQP